MTLVAIFSLGAVVANMIIMPFLIYLDAPRSSSWTLIDYFRVSGEGLLISLLAGRVLGWW